ncbi:hypothetical protein V1512DRAFT_137796 [Lipomyces arxii]|uniref:uncharacterized protein n=1 Tax=Lipomyces arxii TaxID=56418 RepID=UPI0034CF01C9
MASHSGPVYLPASEVQEVQVVYPQYGAQPYQQNMYQQQVPLANAVVVPPGTYPPGTQLVVGSHNIRIERYLSEGGFAHVYVVRLEVVVDRTDIAVLKRVAVPDKENLNTLRTEVDTMRKLKGHRNVVSYIDSHASHLKSGGYEVFLLMEYCSGGGLIDFMNTRLQNRLTESEILNIIGDVAEGVACMHYLNPPLLHRDLKVENVLISSRGLYKVADFGSSSRVIPPGMNGQECRAIEDDIQRHTTIQYRAPEMVDVYRRLPIDEKSDIWALGVLLYKLCYYTTPFEEQGQLAILNATFSFPPHPPYSDRIKRLISVMLREKPQDRPNIYLVVKEICHMRGMEVPIRDNYSESANIEPKQAPPRNMDPLKRPQTSTITSGVRYEKPSATRVQTIPDIKPMRRGRLPPPAQKLQTQPETGVEDMPPEKPKRPQPVHTPSDGNQRSSYLPPPSPSTSPLNQTEIDAAAEKVSSRFPSIESLNKSSFPTRQSSLYSHESLERSRTSAENPPLHTRPSFDSEKSLSSIYQPQPQRPALVSQSSGRRMSASSQHSRSRSAYPSSQNEDSKRVSRPSSRNEYVSGLSLSRGVTPSASRAPSTARAPSGELNSRSNISLFRRTSSTSSASGKSGRPMSMFVDSSVDFLRNLGNRSATASPSGSVHLAHDGGALRPSLSGMSRASDHIESNVEFLKSLDTGGSNVDFASTNKQVSSEHRSVSASSDAESSRHAKRLSVSGRLSGKFSDAFKKFEQADRRSPSPDKNETKGHMRRTSTISIFGRSTSWNVSRPTEHTTAAASTAPTSISIPSADKSENASSVINETIRGRQSSSSEKPVDVVVEERPIVDQHKVARMPVGEFKVPTKTKNPTELKESALPATVSVDLDAYSKTVKNKGSSARPQRPRASSIQNRAHRLFESQQSPVLPTASGYGQYTDSCAKASDSRIKRADTIGAVEDTHIPATYAKITASDGVEDDGQNLDSDIIASQESMADQFNEERFLAQAKLKNHSSHAKIHTPHQSLSHIELKSPGSATSDRKPQPPPKPIKLKVATPSPKRMPTSFNSPVVSHESQDLDWQEEFNRRYPNITGVSQAYKVEKNLVDLDFDSDDDRS